MFLSLDNACGANVDGVLTGVGWCELQLLVACRGSSIIRSESLKHKTSYLRSTPKNVRRCRRLEWALITHAFCGLAA